MRARNILAIVAATSMTASAAMATETKVTFAMPGDFTDIETDGSSLTVEGVLDRIRATFLRLGRRLPADLVLEIDVTDIDLAGWIPPRRSGTSVTRVLTDATRPAIQLSYRLSRGRRVLDAGEDQVTDPTYLMEARVGFAVDPLRYETAMLERWFDRRLGGFVTRSRPPG